jgi:hypothetical protein
MSVAGNIGTKVATAIQGINLEVSTGVMLDDARVIVRKKPELAPKEQPPLVLVVVGEEGETERLTATKKLKRWTVAVVIATAGGAKLEEDTRLRTWREQIDAKIYDQQLTTFATLTGFNECNATGRSPFDPQALSKDLVWSVQNYEIQVIETLAT